MPPKPKQGKFKIPEPKGVPFTNFQDLLKFSYSETPCEAFPKECLPRDIKHVVWDADDTIWDIHPYGIASYCTPPYDRLDENTLKSTCLMITTRKTDGVELVKERAESKIILKPKLIETLDKLKGKGIGSSIASANNPGSVERLLDSFGIKDKFTSIQSTWESKTEQVKKIITETGIPSNKMIFVDDSIGNAMDVQFDLGTLSLAMGYDIMSPEGVLNFIKEE